MNKAWLKVKLPKIVHTCCGYTYNSFGANAENFFRCFAHESLKEKVADINGIFFKVKFCITIWLVCKNNDCITSFTFYYDDKNNIITKSQTSGIEYLLKLKKKFIENIKLKIKIPKTEIRSNKYLWKYTDRHPRKNYLGNIYNFDDIKIGETEPNLPKIYYDS